MIIGSVILEYLIPLMDDDHIFESHVVQFFYELALIKKEHITSLVMQLIILHMTPAQLKEWS